MCGVLLALTPSQHALKAIESDGLGDVLLAALILRTGTTDGTISAVILQQWVIAGASATEFSVFLDEDLDGNTGKAQRQKANGQNECFQTHTTKVRGISSVENGYK